jgi:metallophosphoesterase (TIGR00282 family)
MRLLLIGDIVGKPGRKIIARALPGLRLRERLDFVVANAENSADGSGITPAIYRALLRSGVDCITLGDHIYRRQEIEETLRTETNIVKPANFPPEAPGADHAIVEVHPFVGQSHALSEPGRSMAPSYSVAVISLLGRVFMRPVDCPFKAADRVLAEIPEEVKVRVVDFHAEATSDKQLLARYLEGRVSAVLGTHTHVPTADETILPGGTAFQCDVGMTGPYDSILGRRIDRVMQTTITFEPTHFDVADGDVRICGSIVDIDETTGRATGIQRVRIDEAEAVELERLATPVRETPVM